MSYQIDLQDKSSVEKDLTISIERAAFNSKMEKQLSRIATQAHMKGFRPGKAPKHIVKQTYGAKIYDEVLNEFVNDALKETLAKNELPIIDTAISKFSEGEGEGAPLTVNMVLSLYPNPTIEKYKGLTVEYVATKFDEKAVDERLDRIREMFAVTNDVENRKIVKEGDIITMSYEAFYEDQKSEQLSGEGQVIELGKGQLPEEIEKELVGMELDVPKSIPYTFPEGAAEELKGKEYSLKMVVSKIQEKVLPEVDDEFAKKTSLGDDVAAVRANLEKQVKGTVEATNNEARDTAILDTVVKENDFELPQVLIDREIRNLLAEMRVLDPKDKNFDRTPVENYRHIMTDKAAERIKRYIVLENLLKQEKIEASDDEAEKFLDNIAEKEERSREDINRDFGYPDRMDAVKRMASVTTLFERLSAESKLVEKEKEQEDENTKN